MQAGSKILLLLQKYHQNQHDVRTRGDASACVYRKIIGTTRKKGLTVVGKLTAKNAETRTRTSRQRRKELINEQVRAEKRATKQATSQQC